MRMGGDLKLRLNSSFQTLKKEDMCLLIMKIVKNWNQGNKIYLTVNCEEVHEWNNEKMQKV